MQAPNPFPERRAADELTALHMTPRMGSAFFTNPLNEEQDQVLQQQESSQRRVQIMATPESHYEVKRIRQTVGQPLAMWIIGPTETTPEEVEARRVLRERYLVTYVMTQSQYKARILKQGHEVPIPLVRSVPVILKES